MVHKLFVPLCWTCLFFLSCSTYDEDSTYLNTNTSEKTVTVGFDFQGEIDVSRGDLKQTTDSLEDLFAIQIYRGYSEPYAFVVGNDISAIALELHQNESYRIKSTYVKNGRNGIYYWDQFEEWGGPFLTKNNSGTILNKIYYTSSNNLYPARATNEAKEDVFSGYFGNYAEIDRYYGVVERFTPDTNTTSIPLTLKRMVFGLKLNLTVPDNDPSVEQVRFSINGQYSREYILPVSERVALLEIPYLTLGMPDCTGCAIALDFALDSTYTENISISLGTPENHLKYFDGEVTIKRNKMMVLNDTLVVKETNTGGFE